MTADLEKSVLVYDVGGTHVSAAVCFGGAYRLGRVVRTLHPAEHSSDAFLNVLYSLGMEASTGFNAVSGAEVAVPGPFDFNQGVSLMRHKLPYLYGVNLRLPLAQRFGWQAGQVRFLHDSAAFLLGEIGDGAARGVPRAVGITLGTGIGSAFAVDGKLVTEGPGVAPGGEIWNLPYEGGIVEDAVSSRAIRRTYESRTGVLREVAELAAAAANDTAAVEAFAEFGRHLGLALRMTLAAFAPQVVVLGGGISRSGHLFLSAAQHKLEDLSLKLVISASPDEAPLLGAGVAWFNGFNGPNGPSSYSAADAMHADAV